MNLAQIYKKEYCAFSYEIFPPKDGNYEKVYSELALLKKPDLVSVTYGAGGSNRTSSIDIIKHLKNDMQLNVMPHFTCVCSSRESIEKYLNEIKSLNIENILALRGDEPLDIDVCYKDFSYAKELVEFIFSKSDLSIAVAGYPEGHINSPNFQFDIDCLKRKCDSGASAIYTQMFFNNNKFYDFIERVQNAGIKIPVIPGILPILNYKQLQKMLSMGKVTVPKGFAEKFESLNNDSAREVGIEFATEQCQDLITNNVQGIHFYTLNKAYSVNKIRENLNL